MSGTDGYYLMQKFKQNYDNHFVPAVQALLSVYNSFLTCANNCMGIQAEYHSYITSKNEKKFTATLKKWAQYTYGHYKVNKYVREMNEILNKVTNLNGEQEWSEIIRKVCRLDRAMTESSMAPCLGESFRDAIKKTLRIKD